jgi:hypothetical protein
MEPFSSRGPALPALRFVRRPEVPPERRPWRMGDEDPEQLAREAIVEIQGALAGLYAIREMLTVSRSGKAGARSTGGRSGTPPRSGFQAIAPPPGHKCPG